MSDTPRTDSAYDRAEETVSKFRREDLRKQAEIDELDKECRQLERELAEAKEQANHWKAQCHRGFNVAEIIAQRDALLEALRESKGDFEFLLSLGPPLTVFATCEAGIKGIDSAISLAKGGGQ